MKSKPCLKIFLLLTGLLLLANGCSSKNNSDLENIAATDLVLSSESGKEEAITHLLTVWSDYLQVNENMYASQLWAVDYAEEYLNSADWKDLTKARTACIASARYLTELSMTESDLTVDEYLILANAGMDTTYQTMEFESVPTFLEQTHTQIRDRLLVSLESDIFFENMTGVLKDEISLMRRTANCLCAYYCTITNFMLLDIGDEELACSYWQSMEESYPTLCAQRTDWIDDKEILLDTVTGILDEYEGLQTDFSKIISMLDADLYNMKQIVENNDMEKLLSCRHAMTNVPSLLPLPQWYNPDKTGYLAFIYNEDESMTYPESGDTLDKDFYGMYLQVENIKKEQLEEYLLSVQPLADLMWKNEDEASNTWYVAMPDYTVSFTWEEDTLTILFHEQDVTFAPTWYYSK